MDGRYLEEKKEGWIKKIIKQRKKQDNEREKGQNKERMKEQTKQRKTKNTLVQT